MDLRPNRADVDPLPFLRDPAAFPPYHMRSFYKLFFPDWDGTKENLPPKRSVTLTEWSRLFNTLIDVKLIKNKHMRKPERPKTPDTKGAYAVLEAALTQEVVQKYGVSAIELNKRYRREYALNELLLARLRDIHEKFADDVVRIEEDRQARA